MSSIDPLVTVLIPAYNEAAIITDTVSAVWSIPGVEQVVVVDDGSTDSTAELAEQAGAQVRRLAGNRGKGAALNCGAVLVRGRIVALVDADLGRSATAIVELLAPVLAGEADMTTARFPPARRAGGFGLTRGLARQAVHRLGQLDLQAPLSGQRAMTREVWQNMLPLRRGFGVEVGMTLRAVRLGYRIKEVELPLAHRETGRDWRGFYHRGRQFWHILIALGGEIGKKP